MAERKYNKILWCDKTSNGYWSFGLEAPDGSIFKEVYIGYSKQEATKLARRAVERSKAIIDRPPPRRKSRSR